MDRTVAWRCRRCGARYGKWKLKGIIFKTIEKPKKNTIFRRTNKNFFKTYSFPIGKILISIKNVFYFKKYVF